jgi:hypothetical protein
MSDDSRDDAGGTHAPQPEQPAPGGPRGRFVRVQFPRDWTAGGIVDYLKKLSEESRARKGGDGTEGGGAGRDDSRLTP